MKFDAESINAEPDPTIGVSVTSDISDTKPLSSRTWERQKGMITSERAI